MKAFKITGLVVGSFLILIYLAFLFIVPAIVNSKIDKYKEDITKSVQDSANLKLNYDKIKLYANPFLKVGVKINSPIISLSDDSKFLSASNMDIRLDILPLLFKEIKISKFNLVSPEVNIDIIDDKYKIVELMAGAPNNDEETEETEQTEQTEIKSQASSEFDYKIILTNSKIENYLINISDLNTSDILAVKGNNINIKEFNSAKRINLATVGQVIFNKNEDINYNISINYQVPKSFAQSQDTEIPETQEETQLVNIVKLFKNYEPKSNINTNLKLSGEGNSTKIDGVLDIENFSIKLGEKRLPESYMKLNFENQNINADTNLLIAENEKLDLKGKILYGKSTDIDINCKSDKIFLKSLIALAKGVADSLLIDNDLEDFDVNGYILADFNIKTDLKTLSSNGSVRLNDGSISHKKSQLKINDLKALVNLDNNKILISDTSANVNDTKINVEGEIDSNSKLNLKVFTDRLEVGNLFNAFAPMDLKNAYTVNSGFLTVNADIQGTVTQIIPQANVLLENLNITDKINNFVLSNKQVNVDVKAQNETYKGNVEILSTNIRFPEYNLTVQSPNTILDFNEKDINITPSDIFIDDSKITLDGTIKEYVSKPQYKINLKGSLAGKTIANTLPKEVLGAVSYKGNIPLNVQIIGDLAKTNIYAQALANANNYFAPVTVNKLLNKSSVLNVDMAIANNALTISDIGLYELTGNLSALNDTLSNNIANGYKIAHITGGVKNLDKKVQTLDNIKLNFPASIALSTPISPDSKLLLKGGLNINGSVAKPVITGNLNISDISLPEFLTTANSVDLNMTDSNINLKVSNLAIENSKFNCELNTPQPMAETVDITSFNLTSSNIDTDRLTVITDKMMKAMEGTPSQSTGSSSSSSSQKQSGGDNIPVKISKGNIKIDKLTTGELVFTNIVSPMTLSKNVVYLNGMTLNAYNGSMSGDISYNLISSLINAKVTGNSIDANKFISAAAQLKDQVFGELKFGTDVKLSGVTYEEQMKTLTGKVDFIIENGKLGTLGSIETFLSANNLASQAFVATKIGSVIKTVAPYNSSEFKSLTGNVTLKDGTVTFDEIKSSGDNMSLYITGKMNLLNNNIQATLLGKVSSQLANALGPISSVSTDQLISSIPGVGSYALTLFKALTVTENESLIKKIPNLTKEDTNSKNFKVLLSGNVEKPATVVKSFQWLQTQSEYEETKNNLSELLGNTTELKNQAKDIVNSIFKSSESSDGNGSSSTPELNKQNIQKGVTNLLNSFLSTPSSSEDEE